MDPLDLVLVPLLGWLASGLAAVALTPRHRTARALCAAGVLLVTSAVLERTADSATAGAEVGAVVWVVADLCFLLGLAAAVTVLLTHPQGAWDRPWHRRLAVAMAGLAVVVSLGRLAGSDPLTLGGDATTTRANPLAVEQFALVGRVADALAGTEPVWLVVGFAVLMLRWRSATGEEQIQLTQLVVSLGLLVALLVVIVVGQVINQPIPIAAPLFLVGLGVLPVVVLHGVTAQVRSLERELSSSRARLVAAGDTARRSLERDLHDGVQQQLMALLSMIELASRHVQLDPKQVAGNLRELRVQVLRAISDLRELVSGIHPPVLTDSGLAAALESRMMAQPLVTLDLDAVRGRRWSSGVEVAAYFTACEAVTNALRHAPDATVRVHASERAERLLVEVTDTGPGIKPAALAEGRGLSGLRDRVESLGGHLEVDTGTSSGRVAATFPVDAQVSR